MKLYCYQIINLTLWLLVVFGFNQIAKAQNLNYAVDGVVDFEDSTWGPLTQSINGTDSTIERSIVPDPFDSYNLVACHKIIYDNGTTYRSESMNSHFKVLPKTNYWYGAKIMLPDDYLADNKHEYVMQWHASADKDSLGNPLEPNRSPPLALETEEGEWKIVYRWEPNHITTDVNQVNNINKVETSVGSYFPDLQKWVEWKFYVGWVYDGQGFLYVWKDTVLVMQLFDIHIGYNDDEGTYVKFGLYKAWWKTQPTDVFVRRVYHDNVWRGKSLYAGLDEQIMKNNLKIYPNPATDILNVETINIAAGEHQPFNIYSFDGKLLISEHLGSTGLHVIKIGDLPFGFYFFNYGAYSGKLLKQ